MSRHKDSDPRRAEKNRRRIAAPKSRRFAGLGIEALESRTLLAVTSQLSNGLLDIALGAAGDSVSVSVASNTVDVFDGSSHASFPVSPVAGLTIHGIGATNQTAALHSSMVLSLPLLVSGLSSTAIDGSYQSPTITLKSAEIHINGGLLSTRAVAPGGDPALAPSIGNSGNLLLAGTLIDVTPGSKLLANADGGFLAGQLRLKTSDSQTGENVKASASIGVKGAILRGGDIALDATSALIATASKPLDTAKANLANLDVSSTATVQVAGATEVTGSGSVTISALSTAATTASALAMSASTDTTADAAVAKTNVVSTAIAHVAGTSVVSAGGALTVSATNDTNAATTADGSLSGVKAGGASVAIASVTADTEAFADGSAGLSASHVAVTADSKAVAVTTARATAAAVTQNTAATQGMLAQDGAKSSAGAINLAASLGVTTFNDKTLAYLATSAPVTSAGDLQVRSSAVASSTARADAGSAAPTGKPSGEGVAVAVNHAGSQNRASIGGTGQVAAQGLSVSATTPAGSQNLLDAEATSGLSKKDSTLEGAAAFNIGSLADEAFLANGSAVNANAGDVQIKAGGDLGSNVSAIPAPGANPGGIAKGIGASLAVNIVSDLTRAEVEDGAILKGANNLTLASNAHEALRTAATAGGDPTAAGTSFGGFSAAAGISVLNASTKARIGASPAGNAPLQLGGSLSADATHAAEAVDAVGGAIAGAGVLGAALALDILSARTTATTDRDLNVGGDASFTTHATLGSDAQAQASARGGRAQSANTPANAVDKEAASQIAAADAQSPGSTSGATAPKASTDSGGMTVAAAVALNLIAHSESLASVPSGRAVTVGGALTVASANDTDGHARADGSTTTTNATGVGVGIAINADTDDLDRALIGAGAKVIAKGLTVSAGMGNSGDGTNTLGADSSSGGGAKQVGVAGSLAINVARTTTEAVVDSGAQVALTGGNASISASSKTSAPVSAGSSKDLGTGKDKGIGVSAAFNIVEDDTRGEVVDTANLTGAKGVAIAAGSRDDLETTAETGANRPGGRPWPPPSPWRP